jgi:PadR family transcriptional regulator PadR
MSDEADVWQGTLALMILKTLETMGPLHGYGIARRVEQATAILARFLSPAEEAQCES